MARRFGKIKRFGYTVSTLILLSFLGGALTHAATDRLKEGDACRDELRSDPERKKDRRQWEQCVEKYKNASSLKKQPRGWYEVGRLYEELYLYSNRLEDIEEAKQYYAKVLQSAPKHPAAADAGRRLEKINPLLAGSANEEGAVLGNIRHWSYPDYTRVVIDLNRPASYKVSRIHASEVLSIHLLQTSPGELFRQKRSFSVSEGILKKIEVKREGRNEVKVLLTFKNLGPYKLIPLTDPDRLVIDVSDVSHPGPAPGAKEIDLTQVNPPQIILPPLVPFNIQTIVIDPGHGGKDPGAIGSTGLTEKEVVLDVSLRLKELIQKRLKKRIIMTRDQDVFIPLEERTLVANAKKADLFVSVHANSSPRPLAQGIEIYLLGRATDENAIATAARENATSEKAARDFQEVILNDLEREFNLNESLEFAHYTQNAFVENLIPKYPTVSLGVKQAPFYVLANTNMPAILAEISFISNRLEEKRLRNPSYRQKVAEALFNGIERYLHSLRVNS
ncbi:MAG TPA: N-acetylmuramoyl-L-alanine amidase [Candidatus Manganitrophaceae bacterium]|nr:N-acetylmuramoyl-L-alanine amidase [Candidatus Manganitrophaceae bacterium]